MRFLLLFLFLFSVIKVYSQEAFPRQFVKFTPIDQSLLSLPTVKLGYGFILKSTDEYADYGQIDLGYNYYSTEDDLKSCGLYIGGKYHIMRYADEYFNKGVVFGYSYLNTNMHQYLKVSKSISGFGFYEEFEWKRFSKRRHTFTIEKYQQFMIVSGMFVELRYGLSFVDSKVKTPKEVTQRTFVNGFSLKKQSFFPGFLLGISLGQYF
jgi:hypothetical protein